MNYIVAVSGGVDSMVLLDMMARKNTDTLIVAHFDHGMRPDSSKDAAFVEAAAKKYRLQFETKREALGADAGEAKARERRYAFLRELAQRHDARILTAHHLDDMVETIAINITRGTGWRGLAVLDSDIIRPLIRYEKAELLLYAKEHGIEWCEDSTNASDAYLRNRLRRKTAMIDVDTKRQLHALQAEQKQLKAMIHDEVMQLVGEGPHYDRYFLTHTHQSVALECLREVTRGKLTRPQLARTLHAIKVAKPNTLYEAGEGVRLHFSTRQFSL